MPASSYHHGNLREALVEAAVEAARTNGPGGIGLRDLARTVGVSHSAAYRHFAHRDELVAEVAVQAMRGLVDSMQQRLDAVERTGRVDAVLRARQRLMAVGEGYVAYALAEPGLFRSAFAVRPQPGPDGVIDLALDPSADPYGMLSAALDGLVEVGYLSTGARVGAEATCWSVVHGFSLLHIDGPLAGTPDASRDQTLDQVLSTIDRSYAASTGAVIRPDDDVFARR